MDPQGNGSTPQVGFPPSGNGHGMGLSDQIPPQNLEAERWVLGALLLDNGCIEEVEAILKAEDFYREIHRLVYRAILCLWSQGTPVDAVTVADELTRRDQYKQVGGDDFLLEITNSVAHAANAKYHAEIVHQKSVNRQVIQRATEIIREGYSGQHTAGELQARALERFSEVQPGPGEPWPELTLQEEPASIPFPVEVFPLALQRFCRGVASVTLSPVDLAGAAMLATASAAIGQSVQITLKRTWHESPLLYLIVVAEPGKTKSPVVKMVAKPLTLVDIELRRWSKQARAEWEEARKTATKGTPTSPGPEPPQRRAVVKDITRETLVNILADNPRGVLVDTDEATAWVGSFDQYRAKGTDRQFWLDVWGTRALSVDREGGRRSCSVATPLVTVLAAMPPEMLGSLVEERGRNDGFIDRLLFTYPAEFPGQIWTEEELDEGDEMTWHALIRRLHAQEMHPDEKHELRPHFVGMTPDAKQAWIRFFNAHSQEMEGDDMPPPLVGVWSKLRAYTARFALILSRLRLALDPECPDLTRAAVTLRDVAGAIQLGDYFKAQVWRVHHRMTGGTGSQDAKAVLSWIQRKRVSAFREAELRKDLRRRFPDPESLAPALAALVAAGALRLRRQISPRSRPGPKPSRTFEVNPAVHGPGGT